MSIQTIFFDLDETLYPSNCGLWEALRDRMETYMRETLGIPAEEISGMRQKYFETYGTTLRGLQLVHHIDTADYLAYVHHVDLTQYLHPDPKLRQMLLSIHPRKVIFTNADVHHARRVLSVLGVNDLFDQVIDINDLDPYCKPMPEAFRIAIRKSGVDDPESCLLVDDSQRNVASARAAGMQAVWVCNHSAATADEPWKIPVIHDLTALIPEIIEES
jgi:pyrimidine 5'-nucleotidase